MHKMKRITLSSVAAMAAALIAAPAAWSWGGLTLPAPAPAPAAAPPSGDAMPLTARAGQTAMGGSLIQMGEPSLGEVGKAGYGHGVPLSLALGMLVPATWVSSTDGVNPSTLVSWREGQSWPQALGQVAKTNGWTIVLDWDGHTVTVEGGRAAAKPAAPAAAPVEATAPAAPSFSIKAGESIEAQLRQWAKLSGWKVLWNVPHDWVAPNSATFPGTFRDAAQQVVETLAANGADIRADAYAGNRTMVIHPAGMEQTSTGVSN